MVALTELFNKWLSMVDFPATVLLVMLLLGVYIMHKTQQNPDNNFDFADMLRDDGGKPSAFRLAVFACLAISSWVIMSIVVTTHAIDLWVFGFYLIVWSGAKIADKLIDAYMVTKGGVSVSQLQQLTQPPSAISSSVTITQPVPTPPVTTPAPTPAPVTNGTTTGVSGLILPVKAK